MKIKNNINIGKTNNKQSDKVSKSTHQSLIEIDEIIDYTSDGVNLNGNLRLDDFSRSISILVSITIISFKNLLEHSLVDEKMKYQLDLLQKEFIENCAP